MADPVASWVRLGPADYRRTPWKNGGGVTVDIADAFEPGAEPDGWSGMIWRFGRTRIEHPGPFSDLAGYDRILSVIDGRGLLLSSPDAETLDVREPFCPVRFPGERRIESVLEAGGVGVLNLMTARRRVTGDLAFFVAPASTTLGPGIVVLYAPAGETSCRIADQAVTLDGNHALRIETDEPLHLAHRSGLVAVARLRSRAPA